MSIAIDIEGQQALERLNTALADYIRVSGKSLQEVLVRKGDFLSSRLYQEFKKFAPSDTEAFATAQALDFRLKRRGSGREIGSVSKSAWKRAQKLMGGLPSILVASVSQDEKGRIILRGVRQTKRGKRTAGGKRGTGGSAVSGLSTTLRQPGDKVLNWRAVAVAMESNVRDSGRFFMAASWLHKRFRSIAGKKVLVNANPKSETGVLGVASLTLQQNGGTLQLTSRAPGMAQVANRTGALQRAVDTETAETLKYLLSKETKALSKSLRK